MKDIDKTKEQLLLEIDRLKKEVVDLEKSKSNLNGNEGKYRTIFEGTFDGMVHTDSHTTILNVNPAFTEITGIPKEQVIGKTGFELAKKFVKVNHLPTILNLIKTAIARKPHNPYEMDFNDKIIEVSSRKLDNGQFVGIIRDITKRRLAETALKDSEERLKIIFDYAPYGIFLGGMDGTVIDGNRASEEILGYKTKDITGSNIFKTEFTDISNFPKITKALAKSVLGKKTGPEVYIANRKDGTRVFVEISTYPVKIKNKSVVLGLGQDITKRVQTEKSLRESEEKYRSLFEQSADAILIIEGEKFVDCNRATIKMLGYKSKEDFLDTHPSQLSPEFQDDGKNSFEKADDMMAIAYDRGSHRFEWLHKRKDGEIFPVEVLLTAVPIGKEKSLHVVWRDITDRKRADEALLKSEQQYRKFFEKDISGVFLSTPEGKILDFNPAFEKMLGYSSDEILEMNTTKLYPSPTDRKKFLNKLTKNKILTNLELDLVRKDGQEIHCIENVVADFNPEGDLVSFQGYILDITDRKLSEEALREQALFNQQILQTTMDAFILADTEGKIIEVNESYCDMVGYKRDELLSMNIRDLEVQITPNEVQRRIEKMIRDEKDQFETKHKSKDGSIIDLEVSISITRQKDKPMVAAFIRDITERKKAESIIRESEEKFRMLFNKSPDILAIQDFERKIIDANDTAFAKLGYSRNDVKKLLVSDIQVKYSQEELSRISSTLIKKGHIIFESILIAKNQQKIPVEINASVINFNGKRAVLTQSRDITDRKKWEEALLENEEKYRSLIENSNDAIYLLYDDRFEVINHKFTEIFGYTIDELNKPGFGYANLVSTRSKQIFTDRLKQFEKGDLLGNKYEIVLIKKNGDEIEVEVSDSFIDYKDGKANQGILRDITGRKKQQEILMNAILKVQEDEKNKFGKELHDGLGQTLTSASLYLESLRKIKDILPENKLNDLEMARKLNKQAITDTRRISHGLMIAGIEEYGLKHLIKQMCYNSSSSMVLFSFEHKNIAEEKIKKETKVHLYRIVQELSTNILKHSGASQAKIRLSIIQKNMIKLIVADNGNGFNTKTVKYGAGLHNVNQRNTILNGIIDISSVKDKGTRISITVPL